MKLLTAVCCVMLTSTVLAQADLRKLPAGRVTLPQPGKIDIATLPLDVRVGLLEEALKSTRADNQALKAEIAKLQQRDTFIDANISSNYKTLNDLVTAQSQRNDTQDEKLGQVSQAVGKVPPHSHKVQIAGPGINCGGGNGLCTLEAGGPTLFGETYGPPQ